MTSDSPRIPASQIGRSERFSQRTNDGFGVHCHFAPMTVGGRLADQTRQLSIRCVGAVSFSTGSPRPAPAAGRAGGPVGDWFAGGPRPVPGRVGIESILLFTNDWSLCGTIFYNQGRSSPCIIPSRTHATHVANNPRTTKGRFEMIVSVIGCPNSGLATKVLTLPISHQIRAESREPESREPRAESREPRAESREPRAESREPRAESREPRAESREPRAESREPRAESREPRAESREPRAESREPRAESREPRAESREPRAESREPRAESREPRAESREPRAESREPRAESREPRAESREPRAEIIPPAGMHQTPAERIPNNRTRPAA